MRFSFGLLLILSACGPMPAHENGAAREAMRGGGEMTAPSAPASEPVATGAIGGPVAGGSLGGGPVTGGNIGPVT